VKEVAMTRSLPARPDPESDRKRAKALKKAHAEGSREALARIASYHPRFRGAQPAQIAAARFRLADAQLVVAREYGVESWPRLLALIGFLRADFGARVALFLEAAVGESARRAQDLLARAPELAGASLQAACAAGDERAAAAALERDPEAARRPDGPLAAPPLWTLCWSNIGVGVEAVERARAAIAARLLRAGADPGASGERESSWGRHRFGALYGAVHHDRPALVEVLLEAGADPDDGESLYHATEHANARCLALLLQHGAKPTAEGNALCRALDQATLAPVRLLLEAGADPNGRSGPIFEHMPLHHVALRGWAAPAIDLLLEFGAELEVRDPRGRTPYQVARRHGHLATAEHLLARGADATLSPRDRLVAACAAGDAGAARALVASGEARLDALEPEDHALLARAAECGRSQAVRALLDLGFPLEAEGGDWRGTGLNHAAHAAHPDTLRLFLERGADPERENEHGGTALGALCWSSTHWDGNDIFSPGRSEAQRQRDLVACADLLVAAGAELRPSHLANASPEVADALRRHGAGE
jgi:ankyrin repeat protein